MKKPKPSAMPASLAHKLHRLGDAVREINEEWVACRLRFARATAKLRPVERLILRCAIAAGIIDFGCDDEAYTLLCDAGGTKSEFADIVEGCRYQQSSMIQSVVLMTEEGYRLSAQTSRPLTSEEEAAARKEKGEPAPTAPEAQP